SNTARRSTCSRNTPRSRPARSARVVCCAGASRRRSSDDDAGPSATCTRRPTGSGERSRLSCGDCSDTGSAGQQGFQKCQLIFGGSGGIQHANAAVGHRLWAFQCGGVLVPMFQPPLIAGVTSVDDALPADVQRQIQPDVAYLGVGRQPQFRRREQGAIGQLAAPGAGKNDVGAVLNLIASDSQGALVAQVARHLLEERAVAIMRILPMRGEQWAGPHFAHDVFVQNAPGTPGLMLAIHKAMREPGFSCAGMAENEKGDDIVMRVVGHLYPQSKAGCRVGTFPITISVACSSSACSADRRNNGTRRSRCMLACLEWI